MPTTFTNCYDVETAVETAVTSMLSSSAFLDILTPQSLSQTATPSVYVRFNLGEASGHLQPIYDNSGSVYTYKYDSWNGTLEATVNTERSVNKSYHKQYVLQMRNVLGDYHNYKGYLPYHDVLNVIPNATITGIDGEQHDITTLSFNLRVCVNPTSWPTGSI